MGVQHQLARLGAGAGKAQTVHHVVQPGLQQTEQVFTGHAGHFLRQLEIVVELVLQHTVIPLGELLCTQLLAVFGRLLAALAMLAGGVCAAGDRALRSVAALALQKQFLTFTAAQSAHRTGISSHLSMHLLIAVRRVFSWEDGIRCGGSGSRL